jgi:hypothetical protein
MKIVQLIQISIFPQIKKNYVNIFWPPLPPRNFVFRFQPEAILQTTCFYHTGGFFCPLDGGINNGYKMPFLNPNRGITPKEILRAIHKVI